VSSVLEVPLPESAVIFGEVGLAGEVRAVGQTEARLKEAARLGFDRAILPGAIGGSSRADRPSGIQLQATRRLSELLELLEDGAPASCRRPARPAQPASVTSRDP
jgi:DNA repair protein RadA/Sms